MRQVYYCPDCRAPVFYGEKFCGNCRTSLKWVIVKTPPPYSPLSYGHPGTDRKKAECPQGRQYVRQPSGLPEKPGQRPAVRQKNIAPAKQRQDRRRHTDKKQVAVTGKKRVTSKDTTRVLRTEVSVLLEHLFQKVE